MWHSCKMTPRIFQVHIVASELKDPICHSNECQIGSFSSEATISRSSKLIFLKYENIIIANLGGYRELRTWAMNG